MNPSTSLQIQRNSPQCACFPFLTRQEHCYAERPINRVLMIQEICHVQQDPRTLGNTCVDADGMPSTSAPQASPVLAAPTSELQLPIHSPESSSARNSESSPRERVRSPSPKQQQQLPGGSSLIVRFFHGSPDPMGRTLLEILSYSDEQLEVHALLCTQDGGMRISCMIPNT